MVRCIDYPCCGHTDGLPCDWTPADYTADPHALCDHQNGICDVEYDADSDDWGRTPSGADCNWCSGGEIEPADSGDAEQVLCRGHLAEYEGTSLDELDRMDAEAGL